MLLGAIHHNGFFNSPTEEPTNMRRSGGTRGPKFFVVVVKQHFLYFEDKNHKCTCYVFISVFANESVLTHKQSK